jgi:hypothetical protein
MAYVARAAFAVLCLALSPLATRAQQSAGTPPSSPPPSTGASSGATTPSSEAERQKKLEADIARELGAAPSGSPQAMPQQAPQGAAPAAGTTGGNPLARLLLMPDISAVGSVAGAFNTHDVETLSPRSGPFAGPDKVSFQLQEVELGLQAVVDPYARADVFAAIGPEGAEIEEAYVTTLGLPAGLQLRAGKFFSTFGRMNQQHPHVWEFVDAPLVRSRLLAEETLAGPGVLAGWLAPLPWYAELQLAAQSTAPTEEDTEQLTGVARLLQYFSLGEATTLGVGLSAARRDEGTPGAFRDLGGADLYVRIRPLATRAYLALQGEVYARKLRGVPDVDSDTQHGWWAQAFWRQDAYWGYGARYEEAPSAAEGLEGTERRVSGVIAWLPSEFQRIRVQLSYDRLPGGQDGLEALLHLEFGIGAHGAHPF